MNKKKAITVTVTMSLMLILIVIGLALLSYKIALGVVIGILAIIGLTYGAVSMYLWLAAEMEEDMDVPEVVVGEEEEPTVDDIIKEVSSL